MPQLCIASLNLLNFAQPPLACYEFDNIYSAQQWQKKLAWLKRQLSLVQPDVLALQEVFSIEPLKQLLAEQGYAYFAVADEPLLLDEHIYSRPVVALASKYPISQSQGLTVDPVWTQALGLPEFSFSRKPLQATVQIDGFGDLCCYVVHFKSRRNDDSGLPAALAGWRNSLQRGTEAALIRQLMVRAYQQKPVATMLLGDFNSELTSSLLVPLLQPIQTPSGLFLLQDSAALAGTQRTAPTHYYGAAGQVLDYILASSEFDPRHHHALAQISRHQVWDQHLVRPKFELDGNSSDHALVCVTLQFPA